jgi:FkbM family methyltransferase
VISRLPHFRGRGRMTLLLDRLLSRDGDHEAVGIVNGFPFRFDLRPWGQKFAFYYREWEPELIAAFRSLYRGGDFLDVGSSLGLYVVCMSDLVRAAGARVRAVEPVPFNLERQRRNIALNAIEDLVDVVPLALGNERATVHISTDPDEADNNAIIATEGALRCQVVPLDELARERGWPRIGAMKIDVEGYEPMVIEGGRETIARDLPVILAEFNRERMTINRFPIAPSWDFLLGLGYKPFRLEGRELVSIGEPADHENLFFLPPGSG